MKIGIISDIHGNAEALRVVLKKIEDVDQIVCLGDIVGYGADPSFCIEKIRSLEALCLKGNHEAAITGELSLTYFSEDAKSSLQWTKDRLKDFDLDYLSRLKLKTTLAKDILGVHGSPRQPLWEYVLDKQVAEEIFTSFNFKIYFIGHSHIAGYFAFRHKDKTINYYSAIEGIKIPLKSAYSYLINCGSVGQPRDRNPQACYVLFDTEQLSVEICRIKYLISKTQEKITKANLPSFLAERLSIGI
ncbi:MAG: metallophosphoesterase family protein [Atribacterota bacterium]|nr:metallophosphoesterase family protein [Atribacterota bacterium]